MISAIFIMTSRGDVIINQDYRSDIPVNYTEQFTNLLLAAKDDEFFFHPEKEYNMAWYYHILRNNVYFVTVSKTKQSEFMMIEILCRLVSLCKDFCGIVTEDSLKANFILIQELLLEFVVCGYVQLSSTNKLRSYIYTEPVISRHKSLIGERVQAGLLGLEKQEVSSQAADKPIVTSRAGVDTGQNEIFLDVIEDLSVLINKEGTVLRSEVSGQLIMRNFISGNPVVKLGLNEDLSIGSVDESNAGFGSSVHLDICHFQEDVNLDMFASGRVLIVHPSPGELAVMSYHIASNPLAFFPFRLIHNIESESNSHDVDVTLTLRCQVPISSKALHVTAHLPVPKATSSVMSQLTGTAGQSVDYNLNANKVMWNIQNFSGDTEATAKLKLVGGNTSRGHLLELGPLVLEFELSAFVCSGLRIRFMQLLDGKHLPNEPSRWVRYVTHSNSYVFRLL